MLVWAAISESGVSKIYIGKKGETITQSVYKNVLQSYLIPFVREKCSVVDNVLFWPDLASCHYAKSVQDWLHSEEFRCVQNEENPPGCRKICPIENFWGLLKQKVYADDFQAGSRDELIQRIRKCARQVSPKVYRKMMAQLGPKVRKAAKMDLILLLDDVCLRLCLKC